MSWSWSFNGGMTCEHYSFLGITQDKCAPTWLFIVLLAITLLYVAFRLSMRMR